MRKLAVILVLMVFPATLFCQLKFGIKVSAGGYIDLFKLGILEPHDYNIYSDPEFSEFGNKRPRTANDRKVYLDFAHQYEAMLASKKSIYKLGITLVQSPRAYSDLLELFWGNNEDHRHVQYSLVYGRKLKAVNNWELSAASGLIVDKFYITRAEYSYSKKPGGYQIDHVSIKTIGKEPNQFDWGFPLEVNLDYRIRPYATIGIHARTYYLLQVGVEGAVLMPSLKVDF